MSTLRVVGVNFDHMHMGDLLRMAKNHPRVEIVGVSDEQPDRARRVLDQIDLAQSLFQPDYRKLLETAKPDLLSFFARAPVRMRNGLRTSRRSAPMCSWKNRSRQLLPKRIG